jgi:hypothetical protein
MCMTSSGQNTSNSVSEFKPPSYTTDGSLGPGTTWGEYLQRGGQIASRYGSDPSLIYGNSPNQPMVAQASPLQNAASNAMYGLASEGNPNDALSNGYISDMLSGKMQNNQPDNPYLGATSSYGGSSPQFESMLNASNKDITDSFMRGTAAAQSSAAAHAHAYGGSADTEMKGVLGKQLNDSIAQNSSAMRNDQYNRSAQLEQADFLRNSGLADGSINRAWQGYENAAGRGLQGIGLAQQAGTNDLARWNAVMGAGDLNRKIQTENIGAARDLFNSNVQLPLQALDIYRTILGAASGQGGTSSSSQFGGGSSGLMNGLGGVAALYGLLGK